MMTHLVGLLADNAKELVGKKYNSETKTYLIEKADDFSYVDPIDKSAAKNQVGKIKFLSQRRYRNNFFLITGYPNPIRRWISYYI